MGYVHDTSMVRVFHPEECQISGGTWSDTVDGNVWSKTRTAGDGVFELKIPVNIPQNSKKLKGSYLTSIYVWYQVDVAVLDSLNASILKADLAGNGTAIASPEYLSFSYDSGHSAVADRSAVAFHKMELKLDQPIWLDADTIVYLNLSVDCGLTSVYKHFCARANFTLRL